MNKTLLTSAEEWGKIKAKYPKSVSALRKPDSILTNKKGPRNYPCIAIRTSRTFMTEPNEVTFDFVYQSDFTKNE